MSQESEEELVARFLPIMRRIVNGLSMTYRVPHVWKADMMSDAQFALLKAIRTHSPDKGPLPPWIYFTIRHRIKDGIAARAGREGTRRSRTEFVLLRDEHEPTAGDTVGDRVSRQEEIEQAKEQVEELLSFLKPREREAVIAYHTKGEMKRLADRWGVTESRVSQIRRQALNKMRERADLSA